MNLTDLIKASHLTKLKDDTAETFLSRITHLHLNDKKIDSIENLHLCDNLQVLYLYDNQIKEIGTAFITCRKLKQLHLERNSISKIEGLDNLDTLNKLYLDGNKIEFIEGLDNLSNLEELHISHQRLGRDQHLTLNISPSCLPLLHTLNIEDSQVQYIQAFSCIPNLQFINASNNQLKDMDDLEGFLLNSNCLLEANFSNNAITRKPKYRDFCIIRSNSLCVLDDKDIDSNHRQFLHTLISRKTIKVPFQSQSHTSIPSCRPMPYEGVVRQTKALYPPEQQPTTGRQGFIPNIRNSKIMHGTLHNKL